jgi:hypothetical protein
MDSSFAIVLSYITHAILSIRITLADAGDQDDRRLYAL